MVKLKSPTTGVIITVSDKHKDLYLRAGYIEILYPEDKPEKKQSSKRK
jgi:hypothetical protein